MNNIRLTKEFSFEMAHALWNYDGKCKNIHGHSYKLFVTVIGKPITDDSNTKLGMVMDFGDLKKIVNDEIISVFDHCLVLNKKSDHHHLINGNQMFDRIETLSYQPTCENLLVDFASRISKKMPPHVTLFSLKLYETANSYAEWYKDDNL